MRGPNPFHKESRLNDSKMIRALFSAPKFWQGALFWIRARDHSVAFPRLAIIISKKIVPLAVSRNYLKRLVRETFRHHLSGLPPWDFLLYWSGGAPKPKGTTMALELKQAWESLEE